MMFNSIKNKRGIEAGGLSRIIGIVLVLIFLGILVHLILNSVTKADEVTQVRLCRVSNEIHESVDSRKPVFVPSTPTVCNTIEKTKGKLIVPTKSYSTDNIGVKDEIRDMIANCWYMWLEGSSIDIFRNNWYLRGKSGCFTCYEFRIDEENEKIDDNIGTLDIIEWMDQPYFAVKSEGCSAVGGFLKDIECEEFHLRGEPGGVHENQPLDGWREIPSKTADLAGADKNCCISKQIPNQCENNGGLCFIPGYKDGPQVPSNYPKYYDGWSCPKGNQKCFIASEDEMTYEEYIQSFGKNGGNYFISNNLNDVTNGMIFNKGERYTVNYVAPSNELCTDEEGEAKICNIQVGTEKFFTIGRPHIILVTSFQNAEELGCT